ncbi:MAG: hypothetical protein HYV63_17060 [Candidatus Schekmanbacteria bacterium]|nr:hypothetical protein [Candidatus Schekmanbacteria bacterium]
MSGRFATGSLTHRAGDWESPAQRRLGFHGLCQPLREAARELLEKNGVDKLPPFPLALTAVLEVPPVSSTFTRIEDEAAPLASAASDRDALEHFRRLAYTERVTESRQLALWKS